MDLISFPENLLTTSGLSILLHGVISLPDATSYDKINIVPRWLQLLFILRQYVCCCYSGVYFTKIVCEYDQEIPQSQTADAGPRSAVGNVSGYRCVSDCRSRGREFDPGLVPYFRGD